MLSKARIKQIHSLEQKKYRRQEGLFVAEGHKLVGELLVAGHTPTYLCHTEQWISHTQVSCPVDIVSETELKSASLLQHPQQVLALFPLPHWELPTTETCRTKLILALDGVQDPGNLGTIIRIADWFGIKNIYCSLDTADVWNPKVVQATMGSIARVAVRYQPLTELLDTLPPDFPVYGTMLDGDDISETKFNSCGIIVMGNEGNGISPDIAQRLNHRVLIPNFPKGEPTADSLNVAIATAITCFVARNAK